MKLQVKIYLIACISIIILILINEINLSIIGDKFPNKEGLITTADEASYFAPAVNFYDHLTWKDNSIGISSYFQRTPGYGMLFLVCKFISGKNTFLLLKIVQILLFGGSVVFFAKVLQLSKVSENLTLVGTFLYAFLPCFSGFVYYTLSESVLPFFVLWSLYTIMNNRSTDLSWKIILSNAILLLIRPQLVVFPILLLIFFFYKKNRFAYSILLAFIPLILWNIRTTSIAGKWMGIHPIYSETNNSFFRPPHAEMTDLFRIWEYRGDRFHSMMYQLSRDTTEKTCEKVLSEIPIKYHKSVKPVLKKYQKVLQTQFNIFSNKKINTFLHGEKELTDEIIKVKKQLILDQSYDYFLQTPFLSVKKLLVTSMMNLNVYQDPWRENFGVIILKLISFLIIIVGLLGSLYIALKGSSPILKISGISVIASIFYLAFFQRFNEERYLLPYMSLILVHLIVSFDQLVIKKKAAR